MAIVVAIVIAAIIGPMLFRADPLAIDLANILAGPSRAHPFGCDALGRDVLARVLWGARLSLSISVVVVAISLVVGSLIG
ncbi:MAG TPA: ABC transporter permease, partial [Candidatus Limnocylindrales bacterium]|nr:ABC transporter permease [Candidatus Limnocylindrales bacterium]